MASLTHSRTLPKILFSLLEELLTRIEVNGEDSEHPPLGPRLHKGLFCGCLPCPNRPSILELSWCLQIA